VDSIKEITKRHFDAYSTQWSQRLTLHCYLNRFETVANFVSPSCHSIIDFGCGTGDYSRLFDNNKYYLGVDNSVGMIEKARSLYPSRSFEVRDINNCGLEDESFDIALAIGVFEYLEHPTQFAQEIVRVVSNNGRIICSFPNRGAKLRCGGSLFARVINKLKHILGINNEVAGEPSFLPSGYKKDSRIVHRAYDEKSASQIFDGLEVKVVGCKFANFRVLKYWLGLDCLRGFDQVLSKHISKSRWNTLFASDASVLVIAFDKCSP